MFKLKAIDQKLAKSTSTSHFEEEDFQDTFQEAIKWAMKTVDGKEAISTDRTKDTELAQAHMDVAELYSQIDTFDSARNSYLRCLNILEKCYADAKQKLILIYDKLAKVHQRLEKYQTAGSYKEMVAEIKKKAYGVYHPDVASTYLELA